MGLAFLAVAGSQVASAACDPQNLFSGQVTYTTSAYPIWLVTGDFNGDGIADLVVADYDGNDVSVLLGRGDAGQGDGTFDTATHNPVGDGPRCVVTGDFNEDGIIDLAVTELRASEVSILMGGGSSGVGNGSFSAPVSYPVAGGARTVVTGDFNEDGITDLAVTTSEAGRVAVLLGRGAVGIGDGTFTAPQVFATGNYPWGIVVEDFDEDGIADLAIANTLGNSVSVLIGQGSDGVGNGTFTPPRSFFAGSGPNNLVSRDFNSDGILDLAVSNGSSSRVTILRGRGTDGAGTGDFEPPISFTVGGSPEGIAAADLDADGDVDLVTANISDGTVTILAGAGDGTFPLHATYAAGGWAVGVVPADFDEDGFIDLAVANARDNTVSVLIGSCTPPPRLAPVLTAVRDVPADQGGRVFVTWLSSELDVAGARAITGYRVWRRITAAMFAALGGDEASVSAGAARLQIIATPRPDGTEDVTYWEAIATLPAENLEGYGYTASTFEDSSASGTPYTAFYVSALTPDPFVFHPSNVDSGYSVDNTRPGSPRALAPGRAEAGVHLMWEAVDEPDLASYRVYRGAARDFVPAQENLIVVTSDTTYLDPSGSEGSVYKVSSVDRHDNESDYTLIELGPATAVSGERGISLAGVWPNPTSRIVVSFILGDRARAELELADVSGRIVLRRPVGDLGPGTHRMDLTEDVYLAPGVYFVRLHAGGRVLATRVCLLR